MAAKKSTAKKTTASKKSTARKKPTVSKADNELERIAQETLDGKWGSGRERDISLVAAGHNPAEVQKVRATLRASK